MFNLYAIVLKEEPSLCPRIMAWVLVVIQPAASAKATPLIGVRSESDSDSSGAAEGVRATSSSAQAFIAPAGALIPPAGAHPSDVASTYAPLTVVLAGEASVGGPPDAGAS